MLPGFRTQGLLLEEQEASVDQLNKLGEVVQLALLASIPASLDNPTYVVQNDQFVSPATFMVANREEETMTGDCGNHLLGEERQQCAADGGEVEIMDLEQEVELERLPSAHEFAAAEDDDVVCDKKSGAGLESREGSLALGEAEILRLVAYNRLKSLLEDGPELDTKGAVQRRHADLEPIDNHCALCADIDAVNEFYRLRVVYAEVCAEGLLV